MAGDPLAAFNAHTSIFIDFSSPISDIEKSTIFRIFKIVQNGRINRPLGAQGRILDQKTSAAPRRGGERVKLW